MHVNTVTTDINKFIFKLDANTQARVLRYMELLEKYGNKLGMPYSKSLHDGLFELRIMGIKQVRIIYCFHNDSVYLLNIFIKKTNKTPKHEMEVAIKRFKMLA